MAGKKPDAKKGGEAAEMLTLTQAAEYLGISRPTFYRLIASGKIDGFKEGKA